MRVSPTHALVICVSLSWFSLSVAVSIQTALLVTILLAVNNGNSLCHRRRKWGGHGPPNIGYLSKASLSFVLPVFQVILHLYG